MNTWKNNRGFREEMQDLPQYDSVNSSADDVYEEVFGDKPD